MGIDESIDFRPVNIAVMTVSDSRSEADDRSGALLVERLEGAGHELADRFVIIVFSDFALQRRKIHLYASFSMLPSSGSTYRKER